MSANHRSSPPGDDGAHDAPITGPANESADIRPLMAGFPTGVTIITALDRAGKPWGMTCTSLCSVSLEPPILLVCLRHDSLTLNAISTGGSFAVNLLHGRAQSTAELFAGAVANRFERVIWRTDRDAAGPHLLQSAHTIANCTVVDNRLVGDHCVVMGRVDSVLLLRPQEPLLYGLRRYAHWGENPQKPKDSEMARKPDDVGKVESAISLISKRGVLGTLMRLAESPHRHNELARITGMDNKTLARILQQAQKNRLIKRRVHTDTSPPQVHYQLTTGSRELLNALQPLVHWWDKQAGRMGAEH